MKKEDYIGKRVYAGGKINGFWGNIIDVVPDSDYTDGLRFDVKDTYGIVRSFDKSELKEETITTELVELRP